ncbi:hypothetical protein FKR81_31370 [Lentzea tibetensis]|uniref:Uncharacterized protein n=1 Tax=Lentzea tibetensis TaxID=2591470 RepID=A0A563EMM2_9PSEU|nr:hypothetical protein [Lentzea tibetensis]TWP47839.1 hypothetical protein FKR81_31370 [Lentzea tibetensis]
MSIFGQVWLWSLLSFVAGVLLTWLILVRPVRKQVADLEDQLLEARSVPLPPPVAPAKVEDEFVVDEWEPAPSLADEVLVSSPRVDELSDDRPRSLHERLAPEEPRVAPPYAPPAEVVHVDHEPMAPPEVDGPPDDFIYQPREVWAEQETFLDEAAEQEDDDSYDVSASASPEQAADSEWPSNDLTGEYAGLQDQIAGRLSGDEAVAETTFMEPVASEEDDEQARLDAFHAQADAATASERTAIHEPVESPAEQTLIQLPVEPADRGDETAAEQTLIQAPIDPDAYEQQQAGWRPGAAYRPAADHEAPADVEPAGPADFEQADFERADFEEPVAAPADFEEPDAAEADQAAARLQAAEADEAYAAHLAQAGQVEADEYEQLVESAQAAAPEQQGFTAPDTADPEDEAAYAEHEQVFADPHQGSLEDTEQPAAHTEQDSVESEHEEAYADSFTAPDQEQDAPAQAGQTAFAAPQADWLDHLEPDTQPEQQAEPEPVAFAEPQVSQLDQVREPQGFNAFAKPSADGHVSYEPFATPGQPAASSVFDPFAAVTPVDPAAEAFAPTNGVKPDVPEPPKVEAPVVERPRSLFEPILEADDAPPLTETKRPEPPASQDQPFVPKFVPGPPLSEQQVEVAPPAPETDLPHRETPAGLPRREARRSTPPRPFQTQAPAAPQPAPTAPPSQVRPPRPRPVGFSPSTGGRSIGPETTRYKQPEGFNPRSPFGPGSVLPKSDGLAPAEDFGVKATLTGRRYYTPESANFVETRADVWFRTVADAQKAGFRPAP